MTGVVTPDGREVRIGLLAVRYGTPGLHECDTVEEAEALGESMVDDGWAAPVAIVVDGDLRLTHFSPDYMWRPPVPEEAREALGLLSLAHEA